MITARKRPQPAITFVKRIGVMPHSPGWAYGLCSDGNVWIYGTRLESNCGPLARFLEEAQAGGKWRINLDDEFSK